MPRFAYSALSPTGEIIRGEIEAANAAAVIGRLHDQALLPIEASESRGDAPIWRLRLWPARALPARELALMSEQLARLLSAGLPLDRALEILIHLSEQRPVARILQNVLKRVQDGAGLAEAMAAQAAAFPRSYVSMIRAGESAAALPNVLGRVADFLTRSEAMRQKVVSALIYPIVLVAVAIGSVGIVVTKVLPQFKPLFRDAGAQLPPLTQAVMAVGDMARHDGLLMLLGLLGAAVAWQVLMTRPEAALLRDRTMLTLPLVRALITKFEIGRFSRTLGMLLTSGVAAPAALELAGATVGNRAIAGAIKIVAGRFKEGEGLSGPLMRTGRFPSLSTQLIRIGEETGKLEEMLEQVAGIYDQEVQWTLERLLALLVPGLTIVMGLVVAAIVASILLAMISINNLVS